MNGFKFSELIESTLHLYKATKDPILLQFGKDMVNMIEKRTKTKCGYATVSYICLHCSTKTIYKIKL